MVNVPVTSLCISSFSDINECQSEFHNCHSDATCSNLMGSFTCSCNPGYSGDGQSCPGMNISFSCWSMFISFQNTVQISKFIDEDTISIITLMLTAHCDEQSKYRCSISLKGDQSDLFICCQTLEILVSQGSSYFFYNPCQFLQLRSVPFGRY